MHDCHLLTRSKRRRVVLLLVAVLAIGAAHPVVAAEQPDPRPVMTAAGLAARIHVRINEQRAKHRLHALQWSDALSEVAVEHSRDMAQRNYFGHSTPEGESFGDRYRNSRIHCAIPVGHQIYTGAENIALSRLYNRSTTAANGITRYDWNSAESIALMTVNNWMQSPGHRENILRPFWQQQGIGVEIGPGNQVLVTQNFC